MNTKKRILLFSICFIFSLGCAKKEVEEVINAGSTNNNPSTNAGIKFLALGDSYTIGQGVATSQRWPVQLIDSLLKNEAFTLDTLRIIAQTGWTTQNLSNALNIAKPDSNFTLVSVLIGVNNQFQGRDINEYETQFEALLLRAIKYAGNDTNNVIVLSIPDYGVTPFGQNNAANIAEQINAFNLVNKNVTESYGVKWFNITEISRLAQNDASLIANDGLHPSGKMYKLWVDEIYSHITEMLLSKNNFTK